MTVIFLQDYTGRETAMAQFKQDAIVELPHAVALELIGYGICKEYTEDAPPPKPKKEKVKHDENA